MMERALAWLTEGERSTYGVAVTRIMIGFVVSSQLLLNWPDRSYTWGEGGRWNETVADVKGYPEIFGLFRALGGWQWDIAYLLVVLSGIALMVGVFTRFTTITTAILWTSVYVANPYVGSGGDAVLRMVLFYLCFTNAGKVWSVDAWLRERRGYRARIAPPWVSATLHNLAVVLMIHQIVMVYVGSALWKVQSPVWRDGTAVYYPLQTEAYSPWNDLLQPVFANSLVHLGGDLDGGRRAAVLPGAPGVPTHPDGRSGDHHRHAPRHRLPHGHHVLLARDDRGRHDARQRQDVAFRVRPGSAPVVATIPGQGQSQGTDRDPRVICMPTPSRHATELPSKGRRAVVVGIAVIAVVHSVLVMVWVMPTNPIRDAIGADRVSRYINNGVVPFEQSWSVFAPTPRRGGENVQVRAYDGETRRDDGLVRHHRERGRTHQARPEPVAHPCGDAASRRGCQRALRGSVRRRSWTSSPRTHRRTRR